MGKFLPSAPVDPRRRALLVGAIASAGLASFSSPVRARSCDEQLDEDAELMADVVTDALNAWLEGAKYVGGKIHGVVLYGGALESDMDVTAEIEAGLVEEGVEEESAALIAEPIWKMPPGMAGPPTGACPRYALSLTLQL